ncbi:MAG: hypothetical protein ABIT37_09020 [Luteolibacter sp.]
MNLNELACAIFNTAESLDIPHMAVGAVAAGAYGIPRATKDIGLLVSIDSKKGIRQLMDALVDLVEFEPEAQFDTIPWGRRHVGTSRFSPPYKVELFEIFDDPFVSSEFARKIIAFVPMLNRNVWLPSAEDVVIQKIRWGRSKDLDDARDVLAVQGPETVDMAYIRSWCAIHRTTQRLETIIESLPPI